MAQNKSLSTQEVAQILHVSKSTIYELIRRGEINSYKIGRKVRFTQDDVDAYIARSRHEQSVQPVRRIELQSELLHPRQEDKSRLIISGQDVVLDIPLLQERFDLVVHKEFLETDEGEALLEILRSEAFKKEILPFSGNDYRDLGKIVAEV